MLLNKNRQEMHKNSQKYQINNPRGLWTVSHILITVFILSLPFNTFAILRLISFISNPHSTINLETSSKINLETFYHPASIPWIDNLLSCEKSGRIWEDDKCWDSEHSAMF
jgi:hypothetical protein